MKKIIGNEILYHILFVIIVTVVFFVVPAYANSIWPRPVIVPIPATVNNVENPVISLNGNWKFTLTPLANFWLNNTDTSTWDDIIVPGEAFMQGFYISQNVEYPYKTLVVIPADFSGKTILLRFDGVYSYGRVWINGIYVGEHYGGFTTWDVDITDYVTPGESTWITVGVTDRSDDISKQSSYAKHNIGGIIRNVKLLALPPDHLTRLHAETDLDNLFTNAALKITAAMRFDSATDATVHLTLKDPSGIPVSISPDSISLSPAAPENTAEIFISNPALWDAEHPNLYQLEASLETEEIIQQTFFRKIGFREIEIVGSQVRVNGKEIKLRGCNRNSIHPIRGRADNSMDALRDVILFRDANINFLRTSHHPPIEELLDYADEYGLYVEEETAVMWSTTQDRSSYTSRYMDQFAEMIERDRSHPCVLIWSLGNESSWGSNFEQQEAYAKLEDPGRPTTRSPHWTDPNNEEYCDIYSKHYPSYHVDYYLPNEWKPKLYAEYAHVATTRFNSNSLKKDPNLRNFWGESMMLFWENIFQANGHLGGAIWGGIDEVFLAPSALYGWGRWGILDEWRRPKPEYWLTKKAYSPIVIVEPLVLSPVTGDDLDIPIHNWFDHTDLNEITVRWSVSSDSGSLTPPSIPPRDSGFLTIPGRNWQNGEILNLQFYRFDVLLVDEYNLPVGCVNKRHPPIKGPAPDLTETSAQIIIDGLYFSLTFAKDTGMITNGTYQDSTLLLSGPRLNLAPAVLDSWSLTNINAHTTIDEAVVNLSGAYGRVRADFEIRVDSNGLITTYYTVNNPPAGYKEVGVTYDLPGNVDRLSWDRNALWSAYPADHIGRAAGVANKIRAYGDESYRSEPTWPWSQDMKDFFMFGIDDKGRRATNDFRGTKEYIYFASAILAGSDHRIRVESDGVNAVRMERVLAACDEDDKGTSIIYCGTWQPWEDEKNCFGTEECSNHAGDYAEFSFFGTWIEWIGFRNNNMGKADVYLDDILVEDNIDLYSPSKDHQQVLFSATGLSDDFHTIRIVVDGGKNPSSSATYVGIDGFNFNTIESEIVEMNINSDWGYTDLYRGNYVKDVNIGSSYSNVVKMRLTNNDDYYPQMTGTDSDGDNICDSGIFPTNWIVTCDSEELVGEYAPCANAIDGNEDTNWVTQWNAASPTHPHEIMIDLGADYYLHEFRCIPRQDNDRGRIKDYEFYVSADGINWGLPVSAGIFSNTKTVQKVAFAPVEGRYVKLVALSEVNSNPWTVVAEIRMYGDMATIDSDGDGWLDNEDNCPFVYNDQTNTDGDDAGDACDQCSEDPGKIEPGVCGCGIADTDSDGDGTPDLCGDLCPDDPFKTEPGLCGCGNADIDTDGDLVLDCDDLCPNDPNKINPGLCGCGQEDIDLDNNGICDQVDNCPDDPDKLEPGDCGCGVPDIDTDGDNIADCLDDCPFDPDNDADGDTICGSAISRTGWVVTCDSEELVGEYAPCSNVIDGKSNTFWVTLWKTGSPTPPHEIVTDLGADYYLYAFRYMPRQNYFNGRIKDYEIYISEDGLNWEIPVASGTFPNTPAEQVVLFTATPGRYVSLRALNEVNGNPWTAVAEIGLQGNVATIDSDGDGWLDNEDNCPPVYNDQTNADGDDAGDACDPCPDDPGKIEPGACGCGVAETDLGGVTICGSEISQTDWSVTCDSEELIGEYAPCTNAVDGKGDTNWVTQWKSTSPGHPHEIVIDLHQAYTLTGLRYLPRQDVRNGRIQNYELYVSEDGAAWETVTASGIFQNTTAEQDVLFPSATSGRFVKLIAISEVRGNPWTAVAEINVIGY